MPSHRDRPATSPRSESAPPRSGCPKDDDDRSTRSENAYVEVPDRADVDLPRLPGRGRSEQGGFCAWTPRAPRQNPGPGNGIMNGDSSSELVRFSGRHVTPFRL